MAHWIDDEGTLRSGKFHGESLEDVAMEDPSYLRWLLNEGDLESEEREQVEAELQKLAA